MWSKGYAWISVLVSIPEHSKMVYRLSEYSLTVRRLTCINLIEVLCQLTCLLNWSNLNDLSEVSIRPVIHSSIQKQTQAHAYPGALNSFWKNIYILVPSPISDCFLNHKIETQQPPTYNKNISGWQSKKRPSWIEPWFPTCTMLFPITKIIILITKSRTKKIQI